MSPRTLLSGTGITLGISGLVLLFFPMEVGIRLGFAMSASLPLQLFAGGVLSMAALNWMGRGAIYGGIYGRPIVVSNFAFGVTSAGSLTSALLEGALPPWCWILSGAASLHALAFWLLMRRPPWEHGATGNQGASDEGSGGAAQLGRGV